MKGEGEGKERDVAEVISKSLTLDVFSILSKSSDGEAF